MHLALPNIADPLSSKKKRQVLCRRAAANLGSKEVAEATRPTKTSMELNWRAREVR